MEKAKLTDKVKDVSWRRETMCEGENTIFRAYTEDGQRITVLDRMTGYGCGIRDTETGYFNKEGKFWLASGMFDIRDHGELTVEEAIEKIKKEANTCIEA